MISMDNTDFMMDIRDLQGQGAAEDLSLATQAANGTNSKDSDRQAIQDEIDQLTTEIERVSETTKFNETYLLTGEAGTKTVSYTHIDVYKRQQVWFVRLNGVGKNDLKEECFKEGTIRFSWENENVDDSYKLSLIHIFRLSHTSK